MSHQISKRSFFGFLMIVFIAGVTLNLLRPNLLPGKPLLTYSGTVENFSESVEVHHDVNQYDRQIKDHTRTVYKAQFDLQQTHLYAEFLQSVSIKNGDRISVCGTEEEGHLNVLAFKNHTQGISQHSSNWWANILAGIIVLILGLYVYLVVFKSPTFIEHIVLIAFTLVSFYLIHIGLRVKSAIDLLENV